MYRGHVGLTRFTDIELSRATVNRIEMFLLCAMRFRATIVYLSSFQISET